MVLFLLIISDPEVVFGFKHSIPMGTSAGCDEGENVKLDWDEDDSRPYTCQLDSEKVLPIPQLQNEENECPYINRELTIDENTWILEETPNKVDYHHVCVNEPITYTSPYPSIGRHRPAWPKYGTYKYLPPQRWLHNLEHGGIVALYHPCVPEMEKTLFLDVLACAVKRKTPENGTLMFVTTPEAKLPTCQPFVLLAWRFRLLMTKVLPYKIAEFVETHYRHGPEKNFNDGQYLTERIKSSRAFVDELHCG